MRFRCVSGLGFAKDRSVCWGASGCSEDILTTEHGSFHWFSMGNVTRAMVGFRAHKWPCSEGLKLQAKALEKLQNGKNRMRDLSFSKLWGLYDLKINKNI